MNTTGFIKAAVGAIVIALVAVSVILPIMATAAETEKTFTNDGGFYPMSEILATDDGTYTIAWEKADVGVLTINGEEFDAYETYGDATTTVVAGEDWLLRYRNTPTYGYLQYFDGTTWVSSDNTLSMTASNGTATIVKVDSSNVETTKTATYTTLYVIDLDATDDVMKKSTDTPYVKGDSDLYALGITSISNTNYLFKIVGNIDDGVTVTAIGTDTVTVSDVVITYEEVSGYVDLYTIEKITFNATIDDTTTACTYSYFIVPYEVTAEISNHPTGAALTIIQILPVLILVGVLTMIVAAFINNRRA